MSKIKQLYTKVSTAVRNTYFGKWVKFFLGFLLVTFIIQVLLLFTLRNAIDNNNSIYQYNLAMEKVSILDETVSDALTLCGLIAQDNDVLKLHISNNSEQEKYLKSIEISKSLFNLPMASQIIDEYIIYYDDFEIIIGPNYSSLRVEEYFNNSPLSDEMDFNDWLVPNFKPGETMEVFYSSQNKSSPRYMIIRRPINYFISENDNSFIEIEINLDELANIVYSDAENFNLLLFDDSQRVVYQSNESNTANEYIENPNSSSKSFYEIKSTILPLNYVFSFEIDPTIEVINNVFYVILTIVLIIFIFLLIALI